MVGWVSNIYFCWFGFYTSDTCLATIVLFLLPGTRVWPHYFKELTCCVQNQGKEPGARTARNWVGSSPLRHVTTTPYTCVKRKITNGNCSFLTKAYSIKMTTHTFMINSPHCFTSKIEKLSQILGRFPRTKILRKSTWKSYVKVHVESNTTTCLGPVFTKHLKKPYISVEILSSVCSQTSHRLSL